MPVIEIKMGKATSEMKEKLIQGLTQVGVDSTGIPADKFIVFIQELEDTNIGVGGVNLGKAKKTFIK